MRITMKLLTVLRAAAGGAALPIDLDFTALEDGALPAPLTGATWAIVSGKAVNAPEAGSELLPDPGMEAAYTSGRCSSLTATGTITPTEETVDVHGGSKAQKFTGTNNSGLRAASISPEDDAWYQYRVWAKRVAGSAGDVYPRVLCNGGAFPSNTVNGSFHTSSSYVERVIAFVSNNTAPGILAFPLFTFTVGASSDTIITDDHSLKRLTASSLYALLPATQADIILKAKVDVSVDNTILGLVVRADAQTNPASCIEVWCDRVYNNATQMRIGVFKKVAGAYSSVLAMQTVSIVAGAWVEARVTDTTLKIYYNNVQVGTDLTVSDAQVVSNRHHGIFSSGGNKVLAFFAQAS